MEAAPGLRGFPPPRVDRGASLPRRHISSAAGRSRCSPASCRPGAGRRTRCDWPAFAGQSRLARRARCAARAGGTRVRIDPISRQSGVYGRGGFGRGPRRHGRRGAASARHAAPRWTRRRAARNDPTGRSRDTRGRARACSAGKGRVRGAPDPQRAPAGASRSRPLRADRLQNWELLAVSGGGNRRGYDQHVLATRFDARSDIGPEVTRLESGMPGRSIARRSSVRAAS
jgi:hypothetical protein